MNEIESMIFYKSFFEAIKNIPEENQLELYNAICEYSFYKKETIFKSGISKALFTIMKPSIDSANARYRASVENGKKGGRPKKKTQEKPNENLDKTQEKPNENLTYTNTYTYTYTNTYNSIVKYYEENIGMLNPASAEILFSYLDDFSEEIIIEAIKRASINNKKSCSYIKGILNNWLSKGYKTLADIENEKSPVQLKELEKEKIIDLYEN